MPAERSDIGRLEAFSDGVFAIASTLLILHAQAHGTLLSRALLHAWPSYAAYAVSFVIIGIIWVNQHAAFGQIARVDRTFLMVNVLFLMFVACIPFSAGLQAEHLGGRGAKAAAVFYGATLTLTGIFANLFWLYAVRWGRLLRHDADTRAIRGIARSHLIGPWTYLAATLVALVSAVVAALLYAAIAAFFVFDSSRFAGRTRGAGGG